MVWRSDGQDGDQGGIVARCFAPDKAGLLQPITAEIIVNQHTAGQQANPVIAVGDDDAIFIAWTSIIDDRQSIRGRLLNPDASFASDELALSDSIVPRESQLALVARGSAGGYVATWAETDANNRPAEVVARLFDANGAALGEVLR